YQLASGSKASLHRTIRYSNGPECPREKGRGATHGVSFAPFYNPRAGRACRAPLSADPTSRYWNITCTDMLPLALPTTIPETKRHTVRRNGLNHLLNCSQCCLSFATPVFPPYQS